MTQELIGKIRINGRGNGFFQNPETKEFIEIENKNLNTAFNLDTVEVKVLGKNKFGEIEGKVQKVISRDKNVWTGVIKKVFNEEKNKVELQFIPDDRRFYPKTEISNLQSFKTSEKQKVLVELEKYNQPNKKAIIKIKQILGRIGDNETEMKSVVYDRGLVMGFSKEVEAEAKKLKENSKELIQNDLPNRKDLRHLDVFTIDPADAKDFDDAISIQFLENGNYKVGVHIADPTFFVKEGSLLDKEAKKRATSIYLVDRTIPMLPEVLSNDLCSLNPNEDKMAFSLIFTLDKNANIQEEWFGKTVINSKRRFNYLEAQEIVNNNKGDYLKELKALLELTDKLEQKRIKNGSIQFNSVEVKFKLNEDKFPTEIYIKPHVRTMDMIEEFALLANKQISKMASLTDTGEETQNPFIYRIHEKPKEEKIAEVIAFLDKLGKNPDKNGDGQLTAREINDILAKSKDTAEEGILSLSILRSMQKAIYSSEAKGHYGLSFDYYTHFTSPIRRYPDIIAHRLAEKYLKGQKVDQKEIIKISQDAEHSSEMEQKAVTAERDSIAFKQAQYYSTRVGDKFFGIITGVQKFGIFVENQKTQAQGLLSVRSLGDDYFEYNEKENAIVGKNTKKVYKLGDKIEAEVVGVNVDQRKIDLGLKGVQPFIPDPNFKKNQKERNNKKGNKHGHRKKHSHDKYNKHNKHNKHRKHRKHKK